MGAFEQQSFATTRWGLVRAAGAEDAAGRRALDELCRNYWYPLYAYLRRGGRGHEAAADLVQGLFALLIERRDLARLDEGGGRFRAWLLAALRHHAADEHERAQALKRGGGHVTLALDEARERYGREPASPESPERMFERKWALTVLEGALAELSAGETERGRAAVFAALRPFLVADDAGATLAEVARELGLTPNAARMAVHRLRKRYRQLVLAEVAATVERPSDVEDELARLFAALGT